ncbi:MAG: hypothetical protein EOL92_09655 [Bacteroidia bacterium]|nr:hypothetical protein [Bacteroidia bacterium]
MDNGRRLGYEYTVQSKEIRTFISEQRDLFWFVPESGLERISNAVLVETILNYGSMESVRALIALLGMETVAREFARTALGVGRRRQNYHELTRHYFLQVFKRYAPLCLEPATS